MPTRQKEKRKTTQTAGDASVCLCLCASSSSFSSSLPWPSISRSMSLFFGLRPVIRRCIVVTIVELLHACPVKKTHILSVRLLRCLAAFIHFLARVHTRHCCFTFAAFLPPCPVCLLCVCVWVNRNALLIICGARGTKTRAVARRARSGGLYSVRTLCCARLLFSNVRRARCREASAY